MLLCELGCPKELGELQHDVISQLGAGGTWSYRPDEWVHGEISDAIVWNKRMLVCLFMIRWPMSIIYVTLFSMLMGIHYGGGVDV